MISSSSLHRNMAMFLLGEAFLVEIPSGFIAWMTPAINISLLFGDMHKSDESSISLLFMTANFGLLCMALGFANVWVALGVLQGDGQQESALTTTMKRLVLGLAVGGLCNIYHVTTVLVPHLGWTTTALQSAGISAFFFSVRCFYLIQCARIPNKTSKEL